MGTDWLSLFNKSLADQIVAMSQQGLTRFLEENVDVLREKDKRGRVSYSSVFFVMQQYKLSVKDAVRRLAKDTSLRNVRTMVAFDFAFGEEWVYLDYWGCFAHVFTEDEPEGSVSCRVYEGRNADCGWVLLKPSHVDRIVRSLKEHPDDLPVMKRMGTGIERVEYLRDFCLGHPGYWVAYHIDY
jgi:hypothetical protein